MLEEKEFQQRVQQIERLVHEIEASANPAVRASAVELVQSILELHGTGLERMLDLVAQDRERGESLIEQFAADDLVRSLLLLHGLHPLDVETRVKQALDKVRPYLGSHGGNVELLGIVDGVVHLRLQGSCHGCPSSAVTLELAIEEAMHEFAPDIANIAVEGVVERQPVPPVGFVPVSQLLGEDSGSPADRGLDQNAGVGRWETVSDLALLPTGSVRTLEVAGARLVFCRINGTFYAYGKTCPGCGQALESAHLVGTALICPTCGHRYDVLRAGRDLDDPHLHLEPFPLLVEHGQAKVALPR